jgi:hypothetical protein
LNPNAPQNEAGRRVEPWVCVPSAAGTMPAPTAAAEPLEEPPGVRRGSSGFLVSFVSPPANAVVTVLPTTIAPPERSACTHAASHRGCQPL